MSAKLRWKQGTVSSSKPLFWWKSWKLNRVCLSATYENSFLCLLLPSAWNSCFFSSKCNNRCKTCTWATLPISTHRLEACAHTVQCLKCPTRKRMPLITSWQQEGWPTMAWRRANHHWLPLHPDLTPLAGEVPVVKRWVTSCGNSYPLTLLPTFTFTYLFLCERFSFPQLHTITFSWSRYFCLTSFWSL